MVKEFVILCRKHFLTLPVSFQLCTVFKISFWRRQLKRSQPKPFQLLRQEVSLVLFVVLLYLFTLWVRELLLPTAKLSLGSQLPGQLHIQIYHNSCYCPHNSSLLASFLAVAKQFWQLLEWLCPLDPSKSNVRYR